MLIATLGLDKCLPAVRQKSNLILLHFMRDFTKPIFLHHHFASYMGTGGYEGVNPPVDNFRNLIFLLNGREAAGFLSLLFFFTPPPLGEKTEHVCMFLMLSKLWHIL